MRASSKWSGNEQQITYGEFNVQTSYEVVGKFYIQYRQPKDHLYQTWYKILNVRRKIKNGASNVRLHQIRVSDNCNVVNPEVLRTIDPIIDLQVHLFCNQNKSEDRAL